MTSQLASASVLFDTGPLGSGSLFQSPERLIEAWRPSEIALAFDAMEKARKAGQWLAGGMSYELGYALIPKLAKRFPSQLHEPLLRFGVFGAPAVPPPAAPSGPIHIGTFEPVWGFERYKRAFDKVHGLLRSGDIYQANLTFPLQTHFNGSALQLYRALQQRQSVPHGALVDLGNTKLLSRSPELFFALSRDGQLKARPMKGTSARSPVACEDAALKTQLAKSEKDQAENLMITDLLRNDLARISTIGSVRVPKLFEIESYATVHQMISEVTAQLQPDRSLSDVFTALFPCGSITGAPKIRAMEILSDIETTPRGSYCGSIGWIAPDGSMEFNVAIRTLIYEPSGQVTLNVGGGVVFDSTADSEYREGLLKARFAQNLGPNQSQAGVAAQSRLNPTAAG